MQARPFALKFLVPVCRQDAVEGAGADADDIRRVLVFGIGVGIDLGEQVPRLGGGGGAAAARQRRRKADICARSVLPDRNAALALGPVALYLGEDRVEAIRAKLF